MPVDIWLVVSRCVGDTACVPVDDAVPSCDAVGVVVAACEVDLVCVTDAVNERVDVALAAHVHE